MSNYLLDRGFTGWACYLDADAFISDMDFRIVDYLDDKTGIAFIAASDRPNDPNRPYWLVNAGAFLINFAHPLARSIIQRWVAQFDLITDYDLRDAVQWGQIKDDQAMLQQTLRDLPGAEEAVLTLRGNPMAINPERGQFVRQVLRAAGTLQERIARLDLEVGRVLGASKLESATATATATATLAQDTAFVAALYRVLLLREPEPEGLANGVRAMQSGIGFEKALRSCLGSKEFSAKHRRFTEAYVRQMVPTNNLTELANKYSSDKGTQRGAPPHKYSYLYDLILDRYRGYEINLLELGLAVGGPEVGGAIERQVESPSVRMWLEYFPQAHVFGFDISDFSHLKHPRFTFVRGDGGSAHDMERLAKAAAGFDVIVDDGSHASYHQQLAFKYLFPGLRPGGTYIIEDLQWQSPIYENKAIQLPKTRDFMIGFFEDEKYLPNDLLDEEFMRSVRNSVASYAWFPAFNGEAGPAKLFILRKVD